ncbi:uncharacterized protein LOC124159548 [Ischnura elegans]|uniref:uncharacterized protein LOC124159548 n=1 Tax=Ischnura elegans TaxID=197161 RepID=UPI001ED868B2|nr:uncharacterized protein LOC124159548 [Ischnura elegans]
MTTALKVALALALLICIQGTVNAEFLNFVCPKVGEQCNGCQSVISCKYMSDTNEIAFETDKTQNCLATRVCDSSQEVATCDPKGICRYKEFECPSNSGKETIPDPYSCLEYHLCIGEKHFHVICDPGQFFNAKSSKCEKLDDPESGCPNPPLPPCMNAGDTGTLGKYEYICKEETSPLHRIYPEVILKNDSSSVPPTGTTPATSSSTPSGSSSPTTSPSTPESSSTASTTTAKPPNPCKNHGPGAYPYPSDCRKFYLCYKLPNGTMNYTVQTCRGGSHFDAGAGRCMAGDCTSYPTTASAPSTTPSTPSTTPHVQCTAVGAIADPLCCNCFYLCYEWGGQLLSKRQCCRPGSHFDGNRCWPGDCTDGYCATRN